MNSIHPSVSETIMTEVVFPNDTNPPGFLRGGRMMDWMDIACAVAAQKFCHRIAVTGTVRQLHFKKPVRIGDVVTIRAKVTRSFKTSMEIKVTASAMRTLENLEFQCNEAYFTFVAIDENLQPVQVPSVLPETEDERFEFESAARRRTLSF